MPDKPTEEVIRNLEDSIELAVERTGAPNPISSETNGPRRGDATLAENIDAFSKYGPTIKSTIFDVLQALFVPGVLAFLCWELWPSYDLSTLQGAILRSLTLLVPALALCFALANLLRAGGTAERYFGWSPTLCNGILKTLHNLIWINLPLKFIYVALETYQSGVWNDSLGRLLFIFSMVALSYALWRTSSCVNRWRHEVTNGDKTWSAMIRKLSLLLVTLTPIVLAVMSAFGFHFTTVELSWRTVWTILLSIGIALTTGLISRLLLITQFRIKLRQLERDEDGEIGEDETIDIVAISTQVNRLLRATSIVVLVIVGWQIWAQVLPAINYLDEYHLWHSAIANEDNVRPWITLRHLLMAGGLVMITTVLSRNLPGLMEITFLDRMPLDKGGRYAISFVLRYVVVMVGILLALQIIGFSWNKVQWLAAGLTVGLGFGLQEIFANLISGIIILIERPVRVGDLVTVNGVTGTVTRMQLRATTLKDIDYREYIVPNKRFITEDVMNWTLTDHLSRLILPIGIAYGSDTEKAQQVLLRVARRHPLVLNDPKPEVSFRNFGASTLDFELRVVIPNRDHYLRTTHELNMAIEKAFREANIEIAFPQQDVHIRSFDGNPAFPGSGRDDGDGEAVAAGSGSSSSRSSSGSGPRSEQDGDELHGDNDAHRGVGDKPPGLSIFDPDDEDSLDESDGRAA